MSAPKATYLVLAYSLTIHNQPSDEALDILSECIELQKRFYSCTIPIRVWDCQKSPIFIAKFILMFLHIHVYIYWYSDLFLAFIPYIMCLVTFMSLFERVCVYF